MPRTRRSSMHLSLTEVHVPGLCQPWAYRKNRHLARSSGQERGFAGDTREVQVLK